MAVRRKFRNRPWVQKTVGVLGAEYLRLVWNTSRFAIEPADLYQRAEHDLPVIIAMWHGEHFMAPFLRRGHRVKVLISRHGDGELNAIVAERLGIGTVRGSGSHSFRSHDKGGVSAFKSMLRALADGWTMALTADVPKVSRVAGRGVVMLARESGRPIYPVSFATSRRIVLDNWDRSQINLPFSRGAIVAGDPICVAADADEQALDDVRDALEKALNAASERAHAIVNRRS
jgi:lysophospholipid acyltransferase (LPLAT)-like uncharacterized protein